MSVPTAWLIGNGGIHYVESKEFGHLILGGMLCPWWDLDPWLVFRPLGGKNVALPLPRLYGREWCLALPAEAVCRVFLSQRSVCLCDPLQFDPLASEHQK